MQQYIAGLGRNVISKRTGLSRGSVTNILKAWRGHDNSGIASQPAASPEAVTISKATQQEAAGLDSSVLEERRESPDVHAPGAPESRTYRGGHVF